MRALLDRMLWLEKQLNEANQALSQQYNKDHSDGEPEGQWAVGTHHCDSKRQQTVTTRFLRFLDFSRVACYETVWYCTAFQVFYYCMVHV